MAEQAAVKKFEPTPEMKALLARTASNNMQEQAIARQEFAKALELPLRQGIMSGDILGDIFETIQLDRGIAPEFPLDFLAPGTEREYVAYTISNQGKIPQKNIEGDYVIVPCYEVGASIDWNLKYARNARWDIVAKGLNVLRQQFVKKNNDDGFHTLLAAGLDRNIVCFDSDAAPSQFTKRLVSEGKVIMRRNGGGNSTSQNPFKLTDIMLSSEGMQDIRNWNVDQVDEFTRREIFTAEDGGINRIFGCNLQELLEFGENQEYQLYYNQTLAGTMPTGDNEIALGLDLSKRDSFVHPVDQPLEVFQDPTLHRERRDGYYAWASSGYGCLDNRPVIILSF